MEAYKSFYKNVGREDQYKYIFKGLIVQLFSVREPKHDASFWQS